MHNDICTPAPSLNRPVLSSKQNQASERKKIQLKLTKTSVADFSSGGKITDYLRQIKVMMMKQKEMPLSQSDWRSINNDSNAEIITCMLSLMVILT